MRADQVHVWINKTKDYIAVRVTSLTEDEAKALKAEWGGSAPMQFDLEWQWEIAGRGAVLFLGAHTEQFKLMVVNRDDA